ncbi:golgin subfamily A member 7B [Callithrix jacchus]
MPDLELGSGDAMSLKMLDSFLAALATRRGHGSSSANEIQGGRAGALWVAGKVERPHLGACEQLGSGQPGLAPENPCPTLLQSGCPGGHGGDRRAPGLSRGGGQEGEEEPRAGREPSLWPGRGSSPAAPESGGRGFPLPARGGAWPLLPPPPPPPPPPPKLNPAVACRSRGSGRSGREEPRARPRLPGWSPASAPRSAQPLARTPPPASPWPTCVGTRGARISTADSAPGPSSPPPPTCSQGQHRGQSPSPGPAAASERPRIMATEVHNLQELRRSASLATKVFIQRDYSDGTICQFQTKFPPELDSRGP